MNHDDRDDLSRLPLLGVGGGTVNHGAQRIKAFISKSSHGNSIAASSVLVFRVTPFIN